MKLHVLSDLHLEFAPFEPQAAAVAAADVVILAGDIHQGVQGIQWAARVFAGKPVVYVAGNHEFYGHHWVGLLDELRQAAQACGVHLLEDQAVELGGVRILGCSLWTDFDLLSGGSRAKRLGAMMQVEHALQDHRLISAEPLEGVTRVKPGRLTAHHTRARHRASRAWLERELASGDPARTVVVTHHYVDRRSCPARYAQDTVSAGFGSQLPAELLARAGLWIHGHTHDSCNYVLWHQSDEAFRESRVVCNPRGYPVSREVPARFENPDFNLALIIELP